MLKDPELYDLVSSNAVAQVQAAAPPVGAVTAHLAKPLLVFFCSSHFVPQFQFHFIYLYSAYNNKILSRCFTVSESQSLNLQVSIVARVNSLLTGRNPGPGLQGGTILLWVGRVKEEKERETGQRE